MLLVSSNVVAMRIDRYFQIFVRVILFAFIGALFLFFGWKINQYQHQIHAFSQVLINKNLSSLISRGSDNYYYDNGRNEKFLQIINDLHNSNLNDDADDADDVSASK